MQRSHVLLPLFGMRVPAMQGTGSIAPSEHEWPGGQLVQFACDEKPLPAPYVPSGHGVALSLPASQK